MFYILAKSTLVETKPANMHPNALFKHAFFFAILYNARLRIVFSSLLYMILIVAIHSIVYVFLLLFVDHHLRIPHIKRFRGYYAFLYRLTPRSCFFRSIHPSTQHCSLNLACSCLEQDRCEEDWVSNLDLQRVGLCSCGQNRDSALMVPAVHLSKRPMLLTVQRGLKQVSKMKNPRQQQRQW